MFLLVYAILAFAPLNLTLAANLYTARHDVLSHNREEHALTKRANNARMTWYRVGLGACGKYNTADQHVIAISQRHWDGGSHCFQQVTIKYKGKTKTATVVDKCMECPYNAIDLSEGLFSIFGDPIRDGTLRGSWWFGDEDTPATKPKPTSTPMPTTTRRSTAARPTKMTSTAAKPTSTTPTSTTPSTTSTSSSPSQHTATGDPFHQLHVAYLDLLGVVLASA